jgi:hypothetical protein
MKNIIHQTREQYLLAAVELFKPLFAAIGRPLPPVHVSTGWPSGRSPSAKVKALGECWDKAASADEVAHIFISPFMVDPLHCRDTDGMGVLPTLGHELVHAAVGGKAKHGKVFRDAAESLGLEGKMTSTHAGNELLAVLQKMMGQLGDYPHAKLEPTLSGKKKQTTRQIKCECPACGYVIRTSRKWLDVGVCECPAGHGKLHYELADEDAGDDE